MSHSTNKNSEVPRIQIPVRQAYDQDGLLHVALGPEDKALYSEETAAYNLATTIPHHIRQVEKGHQELWEKAKEFQLNLGTVAKAINITGPGIQADMKAITEDIRAARMAIGSETKQITQSLTDVRNFFLDKDYAAQLRALENFIDLCERMRELQRSGFLDVIGDTILRLAQAGPAALPESRSSREGQSAR